MDAADFSRMLTSVNILYLGARVLILCDLAYQSRFWTQFECWLSMQRAGRTGLEPAPQVERRCAIVPIHGADRGVADGLVRMWSTKTPMEAHAILGNPDVTVTNQRDKDVQLKKILALDAEVRHGLKARHRMMSHGPSEVVQSGSQYV